MGKKSDPQKADVYLRCDNYAQSLSVTTEGRFKLRAVAQQLATFYVTNPGYRDAYAMAIRDVIGWDSSKRPKDGKQGELFKELFLIPIGKGERVFMHLAKREHLVAWRQIELKAFESRENVHRLRIEYIDSRLEVFNVILFTYLGELEKDHFGWQPTDEESPEDLGEDESEEDEN
jgi:hypothetical protein